MAGPCEHLESAPATEPCPEVVGCEDCLRTGSWWVHLRQCLSCGHVGCCDSSPNRHASAHYRPVGHPVVRSASRARGGVVLRRRADRLTRRGSDPDSGRSFPVRYVLDPQDAHRARCVATASRTAGTTSAANQRDWGSGSEAGAKTKESIPRVGSRIPDIRQPGNAVSHPASRLAASWVIASVLSLSEFQAGERRLRSTLG